jgi:hypothetical protein
MDANDILVYWFNRLALIEFKTWVVFSFMPIAAMFAVALWKANKDPTSAFKLVHFVTTDTGRGSPFALGYTMLVVVFSWGVWALIALDKLTEAYVTLVLGAFVIGALGARGTSVLARIKGVREPSATAGDSDAPPDNPAPALERTTTVQEKVIMP